GCGQDSRRSFSPEPPSISATVISSRSPPLRPCHDNVGHAPTRRRTRVTQIGRSNRRHTVVVPGAPDARISLAWAALSDTGYRRAVNADSLPARAPIVAVADGMGGHTAGDFASTAVVTRLAEQVSVDFVGETSLTSALRSAVDDMGRGVGHTDLGTGTTVTGIALTLA